MKYTIPLFLFSVLFTAVTSTAAWSSTVRATNLGEFSAFASNETVPTLGMISEIPSSGVADTNGSPVVVYVPITNAGTTDQTNNTVLATPSKMPRKHGAGTATVMFSITATNTDSSNSQILNVGVQDATDNKFETFIPATALADLTVAANTAKEINIRVTLDGICAQVTCTDVSTATAEDQQDFSLHFFLDTAQNSNTEKTGDTNGFFVKLKFSSQIPDNTYSFTQLIKGDGRLFADLSDGQLVTFMGNDIYKTLAFLYDNNTVQPTQHLADAEAVGGEQFALLDPVLNGVVKVTGLENGEEQNLAFALVNKYQFTSFLTASKVEEPEDIMALLEKQACYLATAGFQREHWVLDRLRLFRDQVLMTSSWGRDFVAFYYRTAPLAAPYILSSGQLAFIIRVAAYAMVFVLDYFWALASIASLLSLVLAGVAISGRRKASVCSIAASSEHRIGA